MSLAEQLLGKTRLDLVLEDLHAGPFGIGKLVLPDAGERAREVGFRPLQPLNRVQNCRGCARDYVLEWPGGDVSELPLQYRLTEAKTDKAPFDNRPVPEAEPDDMGPRSLSISRPIKIGEPQPGNLGQAAGHGVFAVLDQGSC